MEGISWQDSGGTGEAVVFMHPASCDSRVWEKQAPAITAAGLRFIAMDRRGYGRSAGTPGFAADDLERLRRHLSLSRIFLVGTAAGGIHAVDYAISYPDAVAGLVVANSIVGVQDEEYLAMTRRLRPAPAFNAIAAEIRELGPAYRATNAAPQTSSSTAGKAPAAAGAAPVWLPFASNTVAHAISAGLCQTPAAVEAWARAAKDAFEAIA